MRREIKMNWRNHLIRASRVLAAAMLASCMAAPAALAANTPYVGTGGDDYSNYTKAGTTELWVQYQNDGTFGGVNDDSNYPNPDDDANGLGDNLAFKVPTEACFVVKADGSLMGPDINVENHSAYPVNVSMLKVDAADGWEIAEFSDSYSPSDNNAVAFLLGPDDAMVDAYNFSSYASSISSHLSSDLSSKWNIDQKGNEPGVLTIKTKGKLGPVTKDISSETEFATLHWYLSAGEV